MFRFDSQICSGQAPLEEELIIRNHRCSGPAQRGQEKGLFEFGGSTVVLMLERDRLVPDADLIRNSEAGEETIVKMGEKIGTFLI